MKVLAIARNHLLVICQVVRGENPAPAIKRRMSSRMNLDSQITQQLSGSKDDAISNLLPGSMGVSTSLLYPLG